MERDSEQTTARLSSRTDRSTVAKPSIHPPQPNDCSGCSISFHESLTHSPRRAVSHITVMPGAAVTSRAANRGGRGRAGARRARRLWRAPAWSGPGNAIAATLGTARRSYILPRCIARG
jgi:hypothetical protein